MLPKLYRFLQEKTKSVPELPVQPNRYIAERRLKATFEAHRGDNTFLQDYDKIFKEQVEKGILEEVKNPKKRGKRVHYLAHQAVLTPKKTTTKMRIVFDASAHYKGKPSLNDTLHQGPLILPKIIGMIMRFRLGRIATISDVEKAFLQLRLQEEDRDATRCLWVRDINKPWSAENIVVYRFTRVTFGLKSSPFLLAATIKFHADNEEVGKEVAEDIDKNLYVDNLFMTAESTEKALEKYDEAKTLFNKLKMNLREFTSNDEEFNKRIKEEDRSRETHPSTLGVTWNTEEDKFIIKYRTLEIPKVTKRTVLRTIASVYDPMGYLIPLTLQQKIFFQKLWTKNYAWDTKLTQEDTENWQRIRAKAKEFEKSIPRRIAEKAAVHQLVVCTDASNEAMCAVVYLRNEESQNILIAKSRLPALKTKYTIAKLELSALTMGARLSINTMTELEGQIKIDRIFILSDSEIALSWVKNWTTHSEKGVLVKNRCKEIAEISGNLAKKGIPINFGYINTKFNPADVGTRGIAGSEFLNSIWWKGPQITALPEDTLLSQLERPPAPDEENAVNVANAVEMIGGTDGARFNSISKLRRITAWVLRFVKGITKSLPQSRKEMMETRIPELLEANQEGPLTGREIKNATHAIVRTHQHQLKLKIKSDIYDKLNIQEDDKGIFRCRGRLGKSDLSEEEKTPAIILPKTQLAKLLIEEAHGNLHCSLAHTMRNIRSKYWIPKLREQVKKIIRRCIPCQKQNNLPFRYPDMDDLPERRVVKARPFLHVGLDYFGPMQIKEDKEVIQKAYGCIITCTTTRMIHLELVKNNGTVAFINALRRFIARRGVPETITSDNAPTFGLGNQILMEAIKNFEANEDTKRFVANKEIEWKTITPYAPWQGGFYERLIQTVKRALHKVVGSRALDTDSLQTLFAEVEATLNNRPLTYQEENLEESPSIRPIDFVQRDIIVTHPIARGKDQPNDDEDYLPPEEKAHLRTKRQAQEALRKSYEHTQKFWEVWSKSYLTELRELHKRRMERRRTTPAIPKVGQIVLIMDQTQPRNTWKLGKIERVAKFKDNIPREAEIKLATGRIQKRPINLLIPLELNTDTPEDEEEKGQETSESKEKTHRYNLRPKRAVKNASEEEEEDVAQEYTVGIVITGPDRERNQLEDLRSPSQTMEKLARGISSGAPEEFRATNELMSLHKDMILRRCDQIKNEVSEIRRELKENKEDVNRRLRAIETSIKQLLGRTTETPRTSRGASEAPSERAKGRRTASPPRKRGREEIQEKGREEETTIGQEEIQRATAIMEIEAIKVKLKEFSDCKDRKYDEEEEVELVTNREGKPVRCLFCEAQGCHLSDNCPKVRWTDQRRTIMTYKKVCCACLKGHEGPCEKRRKCAYCASHEHHESLCHRPEQKWKWQKKKEWLEKRVAAAAGSVSPSATSKNRSPGEDPGRDGDTIGSRDESPPS